MRYFSVKDSPFQNIIPGEAPSRGWVGIQSHFSPDATFSGKFPAFLWEKVVKGQRSYGGGEVGAGALTDGRPDLTELATCQFRQRALPPRDGADCLPLVCLGQSMDT
ncbi:hypothetical protein TNCV_4428581 [Trichonephila clavipes]|nr:hypothetical protein TNCV_4428581 [Trichonephila clavipes]